MLTDDLANTSQGYFMFYHDQLKPGPFGICGVEGDLDPVDWMQGKKMPGWSEAITLILHENSADVQPDLVEGVFTVFSERLKAVLTDAAVDNVEYFPVILKNPCTDKVYSGYFMANVLGLIKAVDPSKSKMTPPRGKLPGILKQFSIDPNAAQGLSCFRLFEEPRLIVIDCRLKGYLERANLIGVVIQETQQWRGSKGAGYYD